MSEYKPKFKKLKNKNTLNENYIDIQYELNEKYSNELISHLRMVGKILKDPKYFGLIQDYGDYSIYKNEIMKSYNDLCESINKMTSSISSGIDRY